LSFTPYKKRVRWLGRNVIGSKHKASTGFSIDPDVLSTSRKKAGRQSLSSIVESLLIGWNQGTFDISKVGK